MVDGPWEDAANYSRIDQHGRYLPSAHGNTQLREANTEEILQRHPLARQRFEACPASVRFHRTQLLNFDDELTDGFRARYSREMLLVDARADATLREFLEHTRQRLGAMAETKAAEQIVQLASLIVEACGGVGQDTEKRWKQRINELQIVLPADLPIGQLLGGPSVGRPGIGAGVCRHRAILFKYMCDKLQLCDCALVTGVLVPTGTRDITHCRKHRTGMSVDHMWNVVRLDGESFIVDCSLLPDRLCTSKFIHDYLAKALQYHRIGGGTGLMSLQPCRPGQARSRKTSTSASSTSSCSSCRTEVVCRESDREGIATADASKSRRS